MDRDKRWDRVVEKSISDIGGWLPTRRYDYYALLQDAILMRHHARYRIICPQINGYSNADYLSRYVRRRRAAMPLAPDCGKEILDGNCSIWHSKSHGITVRRFRCRAPGMTQYSDKLNPLSRPSPAWNRLATFSAK